MVKTGVLGATGYAGSTLVGLLLGHEGVTVSYLGSHSHAGVPFSTIYPSFRGQCDLVLQEDDLLAAAQSCDVLFLALPAGIASQRINSAILDLCIVIDLGADFRLKDVHEYESWYGVSHGAPGLLAPAVYGLSELNHDAISKSKLIANPGCYTTCSILSVAPLLAHKLIDVDSIIIDAKSGVSGAGRTEKLDSLFCECSGNVKAYGIGSHRHIPEIEQELTGIAHTPVKVQFTPHLIPMSRGILATCYATLAPNVDSQMVNDAYAQAYGNQPFIRIMGEGQPAQTHWVTGSNCFAVGWVLDKRTNRIVVCGAIDNLLKGAAGQAVQNMNICLGFEETTGLPLVGPYPA